MKALMRLVLAVYILVSGQPIWAMSCYKVVTPQTPSKIVAFPRQPEPRDRARVYRVDEGGTATVRYNGQREFLTTFGLSSCLAVIIYDSSQNLGLISHFQTSARQYLEQGSIKKYIDFLTTEFLNEGGTLTDVKVSIILGTQYRQKNEFVINKLVTELESTISSSVKIDRAEIDSIRGAQINILSGEVSALYIPESQYSWSWSEQHNTSREVQHP